MVFEVLERCALGVLTREAGHTEDFMGLFRMGRDSGVPRGFVYSVSGGGSSTVQRLCLAQGCRGVQISSWVEREVKKMGKQDEEGKREEAVSIYTE